MGGVRRAAQALAADAGFDEITAGRLALAATELGTNLVRHARQGALLVGRDHDGGIDLVSVDHGPGMDVTRCMMDGYSTSGTAGQGLGAVRRAADRFSIHSQAGRGSIIASSFRPPSLARRDSAFEMAALCVPAPGESISGDGWSLRQDTDKTLILMADGLGHGPEAARASDAALSTLARSSAQSPAAVLEEAHEALRQTRGAAAAAVALPADGSALTFAGAGNIAGRLVSGVGDRSLMCQHGTLGLQIRKLQDVGYAWPEHALLVLHSDGIATRWSFEDAPGLLQCDPAVIAAWLLREHCRGRDDATVLVVRRRTRS